MIKNTTAVLQKSRCLSSEQAYIQNVMSILVSTFIIRKCSPDAHHNIEYMHFLIIFTKQKNPVNVWFTGFWCFLLLYLAEREGIEPSNPLHSTILSSLLAKRKCIFWLNLPNHLYYPQIFNKSFYSTMLPIRLPIQQHFSIYSQTWHSREPYFYQVSVQ